MPKRRLYSGKCKRFRARVSAEPLAASLTLTTIEPPCGSNAYVLEYGDELLFIDSGFACYADEMRALLSALFPGFARRRKRAFLTHADVDHAGLLNQFEEVCMSRNCYANFAAEREGKPNFREQNPLHAPYCALSKIISQYVPPEAGRCAVVGEKRDGALLSWIGSRAFGPWTFDFYEGNGGHVTGETVIVCAALKLVFSGDIYVNIKGFSPEQQEFNRLAPFLMTGVDSQPALAKETREFLRRAYPGFLFCPGHGPAQRLGA